MSAPIVPGDLVWAVRDCCGRYIGRPFTVSKIVRIDDGFAICGKCNAIINTDVTAHATQESPIYCLPLSWLRKIEGGESADSVDTGKELEAV